MNQSLFLSSQCSVLRGSRINRCSIIFPVRSIQDIAARPVFYRSGIDTRSSCARHASVSAQELASDSEASIQANVQQEVVQPEPYVMDTARIIPSGFLQTLTEQMKDLEQETGWRVRLLTRFGANGGPTEAVVRSTWDLNDRTTLIIVDPSAPNILNFQYGDEVVRFMRRPFWEELKSRYGNIFYIREEGETAAVANTMSALTDCFSRENGCFVVPGIPTDQYALTLMTSLVGGFVFGYASILEPQGFVQRKWVWILVFAPLWGTLFLSFGLGPVLARTSNPAYVAGEVAVFLVAASIFRLSPLFKPEAIEGPLGKKQD